MNEDVNKGFAIICDNCGSEDIYFSCNPGEYENEVYIECRKCGNTQKEWC
ncbi:hypothetical protein SAMN04487895_101606 [Paenibacillus sophorae]|uniref:Uncharacterized protein n=1 Tax=Paenibacillus sophorae TaxID=1333845 RepID=A0A1H8GQD3_9BACL|nr:hypothetical protein [Paenibacillus sophorae]QWU14304.1 hypothetical protein KP014_20570 [Paenibacillus sophorae]SEN46186.1 hypothetical protein SAMN04487895_101606 [Paenibacillus sophorae]